MSQVLYGFQTISEQFDRRAALVPEIQAAIELTLAQHNAAIQQILEPFAGFTVDYTQSYRENTAGRLQGGDEFSRADPTRPSKYSVAFPILHGTAAWGTTYIAKAKMSVKDVNDTLSQLLLQDIR